MRVIFLDIDGVLNSHEWFRSERGDATLGHLDPEACARVQRICDETGAGIVVSSTWRLLHKRTALCDMFRAKGLTAKVWGVTPALPDKQRGDEIALWLDRTAPERLGTVEGMVILDDDQDMVHLSPWLVRTHFDRGLTDWEMRKAIEKLGEPAPRTTSDRPVHSAKGESK